MDFYTLALGIFSLGYGIFTFYSRQKFPEKFRKLDAQKRWWGEKRGYIIHVFGYSIMPIILGIGVIVYALQGHSVF